MTNVAFAKIFIKLIFWKTCMFICIDI